MATQRQLIGNVRGAQGEPGQPVKIIAQSYSYQASENGKTPPSGLWLPNVSDTEQGSYLWTRNTITYDNGDDSVIYTVAYQGKDGAYAGESDVAGIKARVQELEDRVTPIEKGGTGASSLEGAKARLGIDDLDKRVDGFNDMTTGINLLKGTRDFRIGANVWANINGVNFTDDGIVNTGSFEFYKDRDGFTVAKKVLTGNTSDRYSNITYLVPENFAVGEKVTLSFEVMLDNVNDYYGEVVARFMTLINKQPATNVTNLGLDALGINKSQMVSGVWYPAKRTITIPETIGDNSAIRFDFVNLRNGSINFRNIKVERGSINNPIWSQSPFDENDFTTGTNLLRGTRDFEVGRKKITQSGVAIYEDGFNLSISAVNKTFKENEYAELSFTCTSNTIRRAYTSGIVGLKSSDTVTLSFEFMLKGVSSFAEPSAGAYLGTLYTYQISSGLANSYIDIKSISNLKITPVNDVWYKAVLQIELSSLTIISNGPKETDWNNLVVIFAPSGKEIGETCFRKLKLESGNINHPIWSASPFDVVPVENGGTGDTHGIPAKTELVAGNDLNKIIQGGWYYCNSGSAAGSISNCPEASVFAMQVFRSAPKEDTASGQIFQVIYFNSARTIYVRRGAYPGTTWNDWVEIYGSGRQIPITNGGTGAKDATAARQNLGITPLIEALETRIQTLEEQIQLLM